MLADSIEKQLKDVMQWCNWHIPLNSVLSSNRMLNHSITVHKKHNFFYRIKTKLESICKLVYVCEREYEVDCPFQEKEG